MKKFEFIKFLLHKKLVLNWQAKAPYLQNSNFYFSLSCYKLRQILLMDLFIKDFIAFHFY